MSRFVDIASNCLTQITITIIEGEA